MLEIFIEETCSGILKDPLAMPPSPQLKKIVWSLCSVETWAESFLNTENLKKNQKLICNKLNIITRAFDLFRKKATTTSSIQAEQII